MYNDDNNGSGDAAETKKAKKAKAARAKKKAAADDGDGKPGEGHQAAPPAGSIDGTNGAKPKRAKKKKVTPLSEVILAKHSFTDSELADFGKQTGRLQAEVANLQADMAAVVKDFKSRIEMKETTIQSLGVKLANEYEMRETPVFVVFDTKARTKKYIDRRNKKLIYKEEPMTEADWQLPMFRPDELAKTKKPAEVKAAEKKAKGGDRKAAPVLAEETREAALAAGKVDLDLDAAITEGLAPDKLILNFTRLAKAAGWAKPVIGKVKEFAKAHEEEGISEIADALRPFCIEK